MPSVATISTPPAAGDWPRPWPPARPPSPPPLARITSPSDTLTVTAAALHVDRGELRPVHRLQGTDAAVHGHGDLHRRHDRRSSPPRWPGRRVRLGRHDLERRRQPGPGLRTGHRHDCDHGRLRRDHQPERYPRRSPRPRSRVDRGELPASPASPRDSTRQFTATGTYTDGTTADLTAQVTWASATPSVATISNAAGSQGTGLDVVHGHDRDHRRLQRDHQPERHPDGDRAAALIVDRGGPVNRRWPRGSPSRSRRRERTPTARPPTSPRPVALGVAARQRTITEPAGSYAIAAEYTGDANFAATLPASRPPPLSRSARWRRPQPITPATAAVDCRTEFTFTATVSSAAGAPPDGFVQFFVDGAGLTAVWWR